MNSLRKPYNFVELTSESFGNMNVYLISGLGADASVFKKIDFPKDVNVFFLDWIEPLKNESLENYAFRLAGKIDKQTPFILIGLSFGGMLAVEISSVISPKKTILISSIGSYNELPFLYRLAGKARLYKLIPAIRPSKVFNVFASYFGIESKEDREMFRTLSLNSDPRFTKWAIGAILNWRRYVPLKNLIRIHGRNDKVLPGNKLKVDYWIEGGGHFMVYNKAAEISPIISGLIDY